MGDLVFDERSGWYKGRYIDSGGRRRYHRLSRSEKEARKYLTALEGKAILDRHLGVRPIKQIRFADFCEKFLEHARLNVKAWKRYENSVAAALAIFGKQVDLVGIYAEEIEEFKAHRMASGDVVGATINRDLQCIKRMYNLAILWGYARENPVKGITFFPESYGRIRYLTREEFGRVLGRSRELLKAIVTFGVHTGMRQAEMLGLQWPDIDLENRYASLYETKSREPRKVALNASAIAAILPFKLSSSPYVFHDKDGDAVPARTALWQLKQALKDGNGRVDIPNFRFHDLRHTCASWMAMAGIAIEKIKVQLGHKDIRMTMRYLHLAPDGPRAAADQLERWVKFESPKLPPEAPGVSMGNG